MKKIKYLTLMILMVLMLTGCGSSNSSSDGDNTSNDGNSTSLSNSSKASYYSDVETVYFNPTTGKICTDYNETNSLNETKTGCMKWYAYSENSDGTINMILDHNTTYKVVWSSESDNLNGPKEVLEQLKNDTDNWSGVPTRSDKYTNEGTYSEKIDDNTWEENTRKYTIDYNGYKARLVTAIELALINDLEAWDENGYASTLFYFGTDDTYGYFSNRGNFNWLYNYTDGCIDADCEIEDENTSGYWTASAFSKSMAFYVSYRGMVYEETIDSIEDKIGIRPVITIEKTLID